MQSVLSIIKKHTGQLQLLLSIVPVLFIKQSCAKYRGKHLCRSLFLIILLANDAEKEAPVQIFEFCEMFQVTFFAEQLRVMAPVLRRMAANR